MMGDPLFLIAATGLSLSGIVSAVRLIDWFIHSDPKVIAHTGRLAGISLVVVSVPLLLGLLLTEKWTAAIALAAVMLLAFAFYGPQMLTRLVPRRLVPDWSPPAPAAERRASGPDAATADPELIQRSIAVLEEYLQRTAGIAKHNGSDAPTTAARPTGRPHPSQWQRSRSGSRGRAVVGSGSVGDPGPWGRCDGLADQ